MKNLLLLLFLFITVDCLAQSGITVYVPLSTGFVTPATNRTVNIYPMSAPTVNNGSVILPGGIQEISDTNGNVIVTNAIIGALYGFKVLAPPALGYFQILIPTNAIAGSNNGSGWLVANSTATFPAGQVAWTVAASDARYALISGGPNGAALLGANNLFTASNNFAGPVVATNSTNAFGGDGSALGNVRAVALTAPFDINDVSVPATGGVLDFTGFTIGVKAFGFIGAASSSTNFTGSLAGDVTGTQSTTVVTNLPANRISGVAATLAAGQTFAGVNALTNIGNSFTGAFTGNGGALTNITGLVQNTNVIWASPAGNDTNNGLSIASPKLTFDGINAIIKQGQTVYFLPGVYPIVTNALQLTNNNVIAYGATHSTGTNTTDIVDFYPLTASATTNIVYGGTWIYTNKVAMFANLANNAYPWQWAPFYFVTQNSIVPGNTVKVQDAICYGYYDFFFFTDAANSLNIDIRNCYVEGYDYDITQLSGTGTNSLLNFQNNTCISHGEASGFARAFVVQNMTANVNGNVFVAENGTNYTVGAEGSDGVINWGANTIYVYSTNYVPSFYTAPMFLNSQPGCPTGLSPAGATKWNINGHPYPDSLCGFANTDTINYFGYAAAYTGSNTNSAVPFSAVSINVGTLNVTNGVVTKATTTGTIAAVANFTNTQTVDIMAMFDITTGSWTNFLSGGTAFYTNTTAVTENCTVPLAPGDYIHASANMTGAWRVFP